MSYKQIEKFKKYFKWDCTEYIFDLKKINEVYYELTNPSKFDFKKELIKRFKENLELFYNKLVKKGVLNEFLNKGYKVIKEELERYISLHDEETKLSRNYYRKFGKTFFFGLNEIVKGLKLYLNTASALSVGTDFFTEFLLDNFFGLGRKYEFSKEVINTIRNHRLGSEILKQFTTELVKRTAIRGIGNGWEKYGKKNMPFRAYGSAKSLFKKRRIYFLIPNQPHLKHQMDNYVSNHKLSKLKFQKAEL